MLTPKQLQEIADRMQPVLDELNNWIIQDIVKRVVARLEKFHQFEITTTSQWQAQVMIDAGGHLEDLQREIVSYTRKSNDEVRRIFQEAGLEAYEADAETMRQAGVDVPPLRQSPRIQKILEDTYQRTLGELRNYTRTTAVKSQQELIKALDLAHIKVMSGATSYNEAVRETIMDLAEHQAQVVYPTGHVDTLEVAVLRAVRTGTAQASGNMTMGLMDQYKWDIVLTSAHLGARYGDGGENPGNHSWWQGRFFSVSGKDERFPDFYECTGYGTGEGLCGWNCRHSFGPGDGEHNPWKHYDAEENKKAYDLSQDQRKQERDIRKQKRKVMALKEAIDACTDPDMKRTLQEAYNAEYDKLGNMNSRYNAFCDENGLPRLADRLQVAEWNYKEAMRAYQEGTPAAQSETPPPANYQDITGNWFPNAVPGSHEVQDLLTYTKDGVSYTVDGKNVVLDYKPHEKAVAQMLARDVGGETYMVPRVNNPQGVSSPDILFNGQKYDLKTIQPGATENTIYNRVLKSVRRSQSDNYIIDVTNSGLNDDVIQKQIDKLFWSRNTEKLNELVIVRDGKIAEVLRRNTES